jgi:ATP-dependent DNA helicase RecG
MESQNIEYKESWRDEYIKWVSGFANAQGGKIFIGINDKGEVTGVADAKKLLEDIPNKIRDILGILVDVNLKTKSKRTYLEIKVEAYPYPISYKGQYFYRSGSTKQELKGAALDKLILQKQGKRWDGVPQPYATVKELSKEAFETFRNKARDAKRLSPEMIREKNETLLEKLHLKTDKRYLKRAAILLFHPDPEKYITGAFIKIGYFNSDEELVFQDDVHGHLFMQVDKTMDLLLTKYLKATISYKGVNRVEQYPIPEPALREALLNAVAHKDYGSGNPIQISVYSNKIMLWNEGQLPDDITVERLKTTHPSRPYNPDVANTFFRAGLIEAWGRGTIRIIDECKKAKVKVPVFKYDQSGFVIEFELTVNQSSKPLSNVNESTIDDKIINLISQKNIITINELARQVQTSKITIERHLQLLRKIKKLKRVGSKKSGKWIIRT